MFLGPQAERNIDQMLLLPPHARKTYQYDERNTNWRYISCAEAAAIGMCKHYAEGFVLPIPPGEVETRCAQLKAAGYDFWPVDVPPGVADGMRCFRFREGQQCLASRKNAHRVTREHPPIVTVVGGDWRGNPRGEVRVHSSIEDWVDDMQNSQDKIIREIQKG